MKTIYRSEKGKKEILDLYDAQLARLGRPYKDIYVETSFGKTHLIETGNPQGEPLLVFHGGNATTAYNLLACDFLFEDFYILAVDIIGHPGKSAENSLPASGYDYGRWAGEVIDRLGFDRISLFGGGQNKEGGPVYSCGDQERPGYQKREHDVSYDHVLGYEEG